MVGQHTEKKKKKKRGGGGGEGQPTDDSSVKTVRIQSNRRTIAVKHIANYNPLICIHHIISSTLWAVQYSANYNTLSFSVHSVSHGVNSPGLYAMLLRIEGMYNFF